jgi:glycosyltransferase involved in cell wall biosynthesis
MQSTIPTQQPLAITDQDSVLLIGYFVSATRNNHSVCEDLGAQLEERGWTVHRASAATQRLPRLKDMLSCAWSGRHSYNVACVDIYSGAAFIWAEAVCGLLHALRKPYILTLRGGGLPQFAARWPTRVRRLLESAHCVTVPSSYLLEKMKPYRTDLRLFPNPIFLDAYEFRQRTVVTPRLVWMRAFHKVYNPQLAVRTLHRLLPTYPSAALTMFGPDKEDGTLAATRQLAEQLGISDRVTFAGGIAKQAVPLRLQEGDIYLNTPNVDNTPVTLIEAMALGLCPNATNVGGIP